MVEKENDKKKKNSNKVKEHDPSQYIDVEPVMNEAAKGTAVVAWGRMNPMTAGHEKLVKKVMAVAKSEKGQPEIYLTHSFDKKKNPLAYDTKIRYAQKAFGPIVKKSTAKTIFQLMKQLETRFNRVILVAGSDRVKEFNNTLNKYNGKEYKFDEIKVVSAGQRDEESDDVSGISGTKMRGYAATDMKKFTANLPKRIKGDAEEIASLVRKGMNITEELDLQEEDLEERAPLSIQQRRKRALTMRKYKTKIKMSRERSKRKMAPKDKLLKRSRKQALNFMRNRLSKNKKYSEMSTAEKITLDKRLQKIPGRVIDRIATRLLPKVRSAEKERLASVLNPKKNEEKYSTDAMFEVFMESRSKKPQDPDVKDMPGSQPKGYYKGVDKDKKDDRARHFKKYSKMDDDNPAAYKPAPGDKDAKTKPSVHTKKFKDMFGEAVKADMTVRKRPHMALEKTGAVKFDKRFKIFKSKEQVDEDLNDDINDILDFSKDFEDFLMSEDFDDLTESKKALKKKAEKTGISYGILKKVFDRGVAAWRTGHRPGTTPTQWGLARVNSFATKGKGTWGKADKDLAAKVRKEQKEDSPSEREWGTDSLTKKYKKDTPGQDLEEAALDANIHRGDKVKFIHNYVTGNSETLEGTFVGTDDETGRARIRTEDGKLYIVKHDEII